MQQGNADIKPNSNNDIFVSIQLNSNRAQQIIRFLENIQKTASRPECVEVLVHIDCDDTAMEEALEKCSRLMSLQIRVHSSDIVKSFFDLWKPLNELIKMTDPNAYFLLNVSDEFLFETQGWDTLLRRYIGYFPDHIFRVRASQFRFRNYRDVWECGFAPDSLAFYTKKWFDLTGDWNPCLGPDSFQQCLAFYLFTFDQFNMVQCNRDIADPFLHFSGEGANIGLEGEALKVRIKGHIREWFNLMSHKMQTEAKRRAMILRAHIYAGEKGVESFDVYDNSKKQHIVLNEHMVNREFEFSYKLSRTASFLKKHFRKFRYHIYAGGGKDSVINSILGGAIYYLSYRFSFFERLLERIEKTSVGKALLLYPYSTKLRWNMKALKKQLTQNDKLFLYGTGEYAKSILFLMKKTKMGVPEMIIEDDRILAEKGNGFNLNGIVVQPQSKILPQMTSRDFVIIGSLSYNEQIITRLKKAKCKAMLVDVTF